MLSSNRCATASTACVQQPPTRAPCREEKMPRRFPRWSRGARAGCRSLRSHSSVKFTSALQPISRYIDSSSHTPHQVTIAPHCICPMLKSFHKECSPAGPVQGRCSTALSEACTQRCLQGCCCIMRSRQYVWWEKQCRQLRHASCALPAHEAAAGLI